MNKYFLFILVFCAFICSKLYAQQATIKGIIKDKETGVNLVDVYVNVDKTNSHTHSDDKGNFFFINIPFSTYDIEFEKAGYEKQILKVEASSLDTINLVVQLVSKSVNLTEIAIAADKPVSAASSSYISQTSFANRPKNSAQDLLRLVPGLFIAQHAGGGKAEQIFIRGFDCDHGN